MSDLKNKIKDDQGFDVNSQKLIFSGKILNDDRTVESLQIKPKDFLVVMVSKVSCDILLICVFLTCILSLAKASSSYHVYYSYNTSTAIN